MFRIFFGNRNAANVTKGLTGVAAACAVGTVGLAISFGSIDQRSREIHTWPRPFAPAAFVSLRSPLSGNRLAQSSAATDVLTGVQATGAVGTLPASLTEALTGNAATGSAGTLTQADTDSLTGVSGIGTVGSVTLTRTAALTGTSATGAVGSVFYSGPSQALIGVQATGAVGTVVGSGGIVQTGPLASLTIIGTAVTSEEVIGTAITSEDMIGTVDS